MSEEILMESKGKKKVICGMNTLLLCLHYFKCGFFFLSSLFYFLFFIYLTRAKSYILCNVF